MYKLTSDSTGSSAHSTHTLKCIDGLWDMRQIPQCQPTTLLTNFSRT